MIPSEIGTMVEYSIIADYFIIVTIGVGYCQLLSSTSVVSLCH